MLKDYFEVMTATATLNAEGVALLAEAARDIKSREKFRNEGLSPEKLFRQFDEAVNMGNSWRKTA